MPYQSMERNNYHHELPDHQRSEQVRLIIAHDDDQSALIYYI